MDHRRGTEAKSGVFLESLPLCLRSNNAVLYCTVLQSAEDTKQRVRERRRLSAPAPHGLIFTQRLAEEEEKIIEKKQSLRGKTPASHAARGLFKCCSLRHVKLLCREI